MRILTLVRHAKSSWDYPELSDFERPLNARGRREAPQVAAKLKRAGVKPDRLVSSPALRAITTAHLFAAELALRIEDIELNSNIYEASPQTLIHIVRALPDEDREVLLFGHNPGISQAAHVLGECTFDEMATSSAARFELAVKSWAQVKAGVGKLLRYDTPGKKKN